MPDQTAPWVVIVTPTIMDGQVVRWYRTVQQAQHGEPSLSVSRNGVLLNSYLHELPPELLAIAEDLRRSMLAGRDVSHAATHQRRYGSFAVEPIEENRHA